MKQTSKLMNFFDDSIELQHMQKKIFNINKYVRKGYDF